MTDTSLLAAATVVESPTPGAADAGASNTPPAAGADPKAGAQPGADPAAGADPRVAGIRRVEERWRHQDVAWANGVLQILIPRLHDCKRVVFFAGQRYREFLVEPLRADGKEVEVPLEGLRRWEQRAWLASQT